MIFLPESLQEWAASKKFTPLHVETLRLFLDQHVDPAAPGDTSTVEDIAEKSYRKADELLATLSEHGQPINVNQYAAWISARADIHSNPGVVQSILAAGTGTEPDLVQVVTALAGITGRTVISHHESRVAPVMQAAIDTLIAEGLAVSTLRVHDIIKNDMQLTLSDPVSSDPVPA